MSNNVKCSYNKQWSDHLQDKRTCSIQLPGRTSWNWFKRNFFQSGSNSAWTSSNAAGSWHSTHKLTLIPIQWVCLYWLWCGLTGIGYGTNKVHVMKKKFSSPVFLLYLWEEYYPPIVLSTWMHTLQYFHHIVYIHKFSICTSTLTEYHPEWKGLCWLTVVSQYLAVSIAICMHCMQIPLNRTQVGRAGDSDN